MSVVVEARTRSDEFYFNSYSPLLIAIDSRLLIFDLQGTFSPLSLFFFLFCSSVVYDLKSNLLHHQLNYVDKGKS